MKPGFYEMPADRYHADPAPQPSFSSGAGAVLVKKGGTPRGLWFGHPRLNPAYEEKDNRKFDLGSVAHELVLGKGAGVVVIDAGDWKKQATKDQRDEAIEAGKQPCLVGVYEQALAMRDALFEQLAEDPENCDAFTCAGVSEQIALWQEQTPYGPVWCRSMMDRRVSGRPVIYDYKTFDGEGGADPEGFVKHLVGEGKDIQDPHYCAGFAMLTGIEPDEVTFRFVVQCPKPPYLVSVVELDAEGKDFALKRRQWALNLFARCLSQNQWPGYAPRTHYVAPPGWATHQWEERMLTQDYLHGLQQREAAE